MPNLEQHYGPSRSIEKLVARARELGYDVYADRYPDEPGWHPLDLVHMDELDTTTDSGRARYQSYTEATDGVFGIALPSDDDEVTEGQVFVIGRTDRHAEVVSEAEATDIIDGLIEGAEGHEGTDERELTDPRIDKKDIIRTHKVRKSTGETETWLVLKGHKGQSDA